MLGVLLGAGELHFCDSEKKLTKVLSLSEMEVRPFLFFLQRAKCLLVRPGGSRSTTSTTRDLEKQSFGELGYAFQQTTMLTGKAISPFYRGLALPGCTRRYLGCVSGCTRRLLVVLVGKWSY